MAKYKVISLSMSRGSHRKPAKSGDILTDADLIATGQNPQELIQKGFLTVVEGSVEEKKEVENEVEVEVEEPANESETEETEETEDDSDNESNDLLDQFKEPVFTTEEGKEVFKIDDCNKPDIKKELKRREIEFDAGANKPELWDLLK